MIDSRPLEVQLAEARRNIDQVVRQRDVAMHAVTELTEKVRNLTADLDAMQHEMRRAWATRNAYGDALTEVVERSNDAG